MIRVGFLVRLGLDWNTMFILTSPITVIYLHYTYILG